DLRAARRLEAERPARMRVLGERSYDLPGERLARDARARHLDAVSDLDDEPPIVVGQRRPVLALPRGDLALGEGRADASALPGERRAEPIDRHDGCRAHGSPFTISRN